MILRYNAVQKSYSIPFVDSGHQQL